ncbi:NarK/NasA family nitrate transporter [Arthrobacter woluwensis]|uniref:NarK/NasA family nitrate transporter n=1 Tax=Arthrobacter woluwensis TaxID=156980 RepID=UPI0011AA26A0|nr:NarK/NasA family nitrate transporter [Arthrobacter woluwensis]
MVSSRTPSPDPERALRDEQARARHKLLAGPHILARGKDGELHSYTLDEYGNSTHGLESQIRSVWGMTLLTLGVLATAVTCLIAFIYSCTTPAGPAWLGVVGFVVLGACTWIGAQATLREARAKALRRRKGIPDPIK